MEVYYINEAKKTNKEERINRYGEAAYERHLEQCSEWTKAHPKEHNVANQKWRKTHPDSIKTWREKNKKKVIMFNQELNRKGGKYYDKKIEFMHTGISGDKNKIRIKHARDYKSYKQIIAPGSQIHHEWIPETAEYRGVALVEKDAHMHGFVDVIEIVEGRITLFTEEEVKGGDKN